MILAAAFTETTLLGPCPVNRAEDLATPQVFARDPELVWRSYSMRRRTAAAGSPNQGHIALARLEEKLGERMFVCTQNVDNLHEQAGSIRVRHMHGHLFRSRCSDRNCPTLPFEDKRIYEKKSDIARCKKCGALIRPDICWFGETPFHMQEVLGTLHRCTVFLAVGSSGIVEPAASFVQLARQYEARAYYLGLEERTDS